MVFPSIIVALGNAAHFYFVYGAFKAAGVHPRIPAMVAWWLLQMALPHVYIWYTSSAISASRGATAAAGQHRGVAVRTAGVARLEAKSPAPSNKLGDSPPGGGCSGASDDEGPSAASCKPAKRVSGDAGIKLMPHKVPAAGAQEVAANREELNQGQGRGQEQGSNAHGASAHYPDVETCQAGMPSQQQQQDASALTQALRPVDSAEEHLIMCNDAGSDCVKDCCQAPQVKAWALNAAAVKPEHALMVRVQSVYFGGGGTGAAGAGW
jgi:hypothetical protein